VLLDIVESFLQIRPEFLFHFLSQVFSISFAILYQELRVHFPGIGVLVDQGI